MRRCSIYSIRVRVVYASVQQSLKTIAPHCSPPAKEHTVEASNGGLHEAAFDEKNQKSFAGASIVDDVRLGRARQRRKLYGEPLKDHGYTPAAGYSHNCGGKAARNIGVADSP